MGKTKDITGNRYGRLTALSLHHKNKYKDKNGKTNTDTYWTCKCDCGNECVVKLNHLTTGSTKSCGCLHKESTSKNFKKSITHGDSKTKLYRIYCHIKERCTNINCKDYKDYGGRGIRCEWSTYEEFKKDMYESFIEHCNLYSEKETTIERKNVNGNYCKNNCKWATNLEQANNKRNTTKVIMPDGSTKTLTEISKLHGIKRSTLNTRYCRSKYNKTGKIPYEELIKEVEDIV